MHDYSLDKQPKEKILFFLAFISILVSPIVRDFFSSLSFVTKNNLQILFSGITTTGIFGLVYFAFDNYLWKVKWVRKVLMMPDLNGTWSCLGTTKRKSGEVIEINWDAKIKISQSWSKILIFLQTKESNSKSTSASIKRIEGKGFQLLYTYENSPSDIIEGFNKHDGCVELIIDLDCEDAEGNYFTDAHRSTVGKMTLGKCK